MAIGRSLLRQLTAEPFTAHEIAEGVVKRLAIARYAWLTTVAPSGLPIPTLIWFYFDRSLITVYSQPNADRVTHLFQHPQVSLHLEATSLNLQDGIASHGTRISMTPTTLWTTIPA